MACLRGVCVELVRGEPGCSVVAAAAADMSVGGGGRTGPDDWLRVILSGGYTSVLEHCSYTFLVTCSRVCSHQLVRHRIASYTQLSQRRSEWPVADAVARLLGLERPPSTRDEWRMAADDLENMLNVIGTYIYTGDDDACVDAGYVAYGVKCSELIPRLVEALTAAFVKPPSIEDDAWWVLRHLDALHAYAEARAAGVPKEDARYLLPQSVKTKILVTMNARELLEVFIPLRLCARAQWEIRTVAALILQELRRIEPGLWVYAGPRCLRLAQLSMKRLCTLDELVQGKCRLPLERCPEGVPVDKIPECVRGALLAEKLLGDLGHEPGGDARQGRHGDI